MCVRNYKCFGVSETSRQGGVGDEPGVVRWGQIMADLLETTV